MTAANAVRCACCETPRPAAELYEPVPGLGEYRCRDVAGCRRRIAYIGDPVGPPVGNRPPVVPGASCSICATAGNAYERSGGVYVCIDRAACAERSIEAQYLTAWTDSSPDRLIAETAGHLRMPAARPVKVLAEQPELDYAEMAGRAAQEALGRRAGGTSATTAT